MQYNLNQKPYIIGIAGGSGSGKTFFLNCFLEHFKKDEITLVSQDGYYISTNIKTKEEKRVHNFDAATSFYRESFCHDILALIAGKTLFKEEYTFNNNTLKSKTLEIRPTPILVVEGLFIFHFEEINALLDHRIFIHAEEEIALARRLKRDLNERGYKEEDVLYKWNNHALPAFNDYLLPYKKQCDQIIENNEDNAENIIAITNDISGFLRQSFF